MNNESHPVCRIFISHSSKDNEFGVKLAIDLRRKLGENAVWYDSLGLRAGVPWWHNIVGEVATRDVFILIISPEAMLSDWVRREYDIALQQKKQIIPLLYLKTEDIWPDLKRLHYISFAEPNIYENAFEKLLQDLPLPEHKNDDNAPEDDIKNRLTRLDADFQSKDWAKFTSGVEELKKRKPEAVTSFIYYSQGKAFLALDDKTNAIDALKKAHAIESDEQQRLRILTELIPVFASLKQWVEVEQSTRMALKLSPENPTFLSQRRDALLAILKSTDNNEQRLRLLYDLCFALASLSQWDDILLYSSEALQLAPNDPHFLTQRRDALLVILNNRKQRLTLLADLCATLASLGQWDSVLVYTKEALHLAPDNPDFLTWRRDALERLLSTRNDQEERLRLLRELSPVLASLSQWEDVLYYAGEALELVPNDPHFLTQRRDVLNRLLSTTYDQEQQLRLLRELCSVLAELGQWVDVLQCTGEARQLAPKDYTIIRLQNHARIHLGARKVSATYDVLSDRMRAWTSYWKSFTQNLITGVRQLIKRKWFKPAFSVMLVLVILGSVHAFLPLTPPSTIIRIGVDLPLTGDGQADGQPIRYGIDLAIKDANSNHTIPGFQLDDSQSLKDDVNGNLPDPGTGVQNIKDLTADALVAGVIGPFDSSIAQAEMPIANKAPIALISPSNTYPCLTKGTSTPECTGTNDLLPTLRPTRKVTYFRIPATDDYQGPALADYLYEDLGYRTASVIDDKEVYGIGLATAFINEWKKLKGSVTAHEIDPNTGDYSSLVNAMATNPPDVVFFAGKDDTGAEDFYNQMKLNNALQRTAYAGGSGIVSPPSFTTIVNPIVNPIYGSFSFANIETLTVAVNFKGHFGREEGASNYGRYTAAGYDCTNILIQAIKIAIKNGVRTPRDSSDTSSAKTFRQAIISAIQNISYDGITGHISFDANGDSTNKTVSIYMVADVNGQPSWRRLKQVTIGGNPSTSK